MKQLLMNERKYIEDIIEISEKEKDSKKVYSYNFPKVINLLVRLNTIETCELSDDKKEELNKKVDKSYTNRRNFEKDDIKKQNPKRTLEEIKEEKLNAMMYDLIKQEMYNVVRDTMKKISYKYIEEQWRYFVLGNIKQQMKEHKQLKDLEAIYFTDYDMKVLNYTDEETGQTLMEEEKKLLFTLMALVKYYNPENPTNVKLNMSLNDIFKFANMGSRKKDVKQQIIKNLQDLNLVKINFYYGKGKHEISYQVLNVDKNDKEDSVFFISRLNNELQELRDIGKKYKDMIKIRNNKKYKQCERCGCLIEKNSKDNNKNCKPCAEEINKEKTKERMKMMRNS